jgi:ArsR family transcriptional regulator, arsenate/arsenite/antimonite-responsive transcriptional repressor
VYHYSWGVAVEKELAKMFKALSNPNRLQLYCEILQSQKTSMEEDHECFVYTIMGKLNIGAPTISHHLKELVNADLISTERRGKFLTCAINTDSVQRLKTFFSNEGR